MCAVSIGMDSIISVSNRQQYPSTFQLPFLDSLFRAANVESLSITARNDSLRLLSVRFKPASVYGSYQLHYNANTHLIERIEYFTREIGGEEGHSGTGLITVRLHHYSFQPLDAELFHEERFVQKTNGAFQAQPPFAGFKLIVNTDK
jgi:hypothetical protein